MIKSRKSEDFQDPKNQGFLRTRKAQEEMTGFIVIILLIAVILIGAMIFFVRPKQQVTELKSVEATQLLSSILGYTASDCSNKDIKDVIRDCNSGKSCGQQNACIFLNSTVPAIMNASIGQVSKEKAIHGWKFTALDIAANQTILNLSKGSLNGSMIGASYIIAMPDINVELRLYYNQTA
ncbi:hypothetical protein COS75_01140 [Candidatus Pacearchaeota archaeon CG06_land_8_20_14_3_00_35_12]|nr:MAG: hypothetical protein COS75_01140 [Candidatus Pacearchaeota archaeon CG06_land_8_20_14_3_00_35_12]